MAFNFVAASSQSLTPSAMTDITTTMSFGCRARPTSGVAGQRTLFGKGKTADGSDRNYGFDYRSIAGTPNLECYFTDSPGSFVEYRKAVTLTTNTWYSIIWTVDWTQNPDAIKLYLDGVDQSAALAAGSNNVTPTTTATQESRVAALHSGGDFWDGDMAELFVTRDIVTPAEAASLAAGYSPRFLLGLHTFDIHLPLIGRNSPETDPITGKTATLNNAPTAAAHSRVFMPSAFSMPVRAPVMADFSVFRLLGLAAAEY